MTLDERLAKYARWDEGSGCLLWHGALTKNGYGAVFIRGQTREIHRVVFEAQNGPIAPGFHVDNICWVPNCCNVAHLRLLPALKNSRRQRSAFAKHCKSGHELAGANLY